jgi:hypothetical protein
LEREIPFIIAGKTIRKNYKIPQPVMTYDTAATIAHIFNLDPPDFWEGRVINVFDGKKASDSQAGPTASFRD